MRRRDFVQVGQSIMGVSLMVGMWALSASAAPTTEEIQRSIINKGSQGKYCVRCHGSGETIKLDTLERIDSQSLKICETVLSKDKAIMKSLGGYNSWTLETKVLLAEWCKEKGWKEEEPAAPSEPSVLGSDHSGGSNSMVLDLNSKIDAIYVNNCITCHSDSDQWKHPPYFCQTVYNRSMPWGYFRLIDEWTPEEQSDFAEWCKLRIPKADHRRLQIPE